jgi:glycosyltransferase involved in cell wall biosynthesis
MPTKGSPAMNILMLTNVYTPCVGGVTRSIQAFAQQYRRRGHRVLIVAPTFDDQPEKEGDVLRFPAISKSYKRYYSLPLPLPGYLYNTIRNFQPDVIHSHHPFLLGSVAQREAVVWNVPIVYTFHTRYRRFAQTNGLPPPVVDLVWSLAVTYCEQCDMVIAPSQSMADLLREHGVTAAIEVIPTGVELDRFAQGDGRTTRRELGIPADAFVVGHVGRISAEKNIQLLADGVARLMRRRPHIHFLLVGDGAAMSQLDDAFAQSTLYARVHKPGFLEGQSLVNAYHTMNVFAFTSQSDTQGMVLVEAMAAGVPVVALSASGVRDVVIDGRNGSLFHSAEAGHLAKCLEAFIDVPDERHREMCQAARQTAEHLSAPRCAGKALELYETVIAARESESATDTTSSVIRFLDYEWKAWSKLVEVFGSTLFSSTPDSHKAL